MAFKASIGNKKLGRDTIIINMNSATDCPSAKLGLCKLGSRCYALKAERIYPQVLPFRRSQQLQWKSMEVSQIADEVSRVKGVKYLRFSEAGDFEGQADVDKMSKLADILEKYGIRVYGYTARRDLDFSRVSRNMVVNGSSFMVSNQFTAVSQYTGKVHCKGNCRICNICKVSQGLKVEVLLH